MRPLLLNAFEMASVVHQSPGLWRHPEDRSTGLFGLAPWLDLARTLERGLFDGLFLADVLGIYDVFGGRRDAAVRHGVQVPALDPLLLVPAMATVTEHLGFGVTVNLSYEPAYLIARRFSTLDHLTAGRIGWNVVTGYLDSAARAFGLDRQPAHDDRYGAAEEILSAIYALWRDSWAPGAVLADPDRGFADPSAVRAIAHRSPALALEAVHLVSPSPQRVPVIYQAGTSTAGRAFAGRHAECVFISGPSAAVAGPRVAAVRAAAAEAGRDPRSIRIFALMTAILDRTDAAARAKEKDLRSYGDEEAALALLSGWTGVDFAGVPGDQPVRHVENDAGRSALEAITRADPDRTWTVGEVARHVTIGGIGPVVAGSPATVADALQAFVRETDVDGFNLAFATRPGTMRDVVDLLVPELQSRGVYKTAYAPGTLRDKLFGPGAVHPADHTAERPADRREGP